MSLAQSIFGNALSEKKKKNEALASLFEKPIAAPAVNPTKKQDDGEEGRSKKKKNAQADSSSDDDASSSDDSSSSSSSSNDSKEGDYLKDDTKDTAKNTESNDSNSKVFTQVSAKQVESKLDEDNKGRTEEEEMRTVFVGNLPLSTTRKSLAKIFKDCGKVQSTRLRSVAVAGVKLPQEHAGNQNLVKKVCSNIKQLDTEAKSSVQGYVVFAEKESVEKAMRLNNTPVQDDNPHATRAVRRIRVDYANPTLDPKRSVFVGNLPYQAEEASLQDHFVRGCGLEITDVEGVRVIRDKETFQCKGFGYILFKDATMVATALQKMHETVYMRRPLRVKVCGKSIKGRKGAPKRKMGDNGHDEGNPNKKQRRSFEGKRATPLEGAMKRVAHKKKKRARGEKKSKGNQPSLKPGVSKRVASEAKIDKRVKKLKKRISKGMGKARN